MSAIPKSFADRFRLISRLKFAPKDLELHHFALKDVADGDLQYAVERAARECDEFPSPKMLRAFITERRSQYETPAPIDDPARETPIDAKSITVPHIEKPLTITREWHYYCDDCNDSGWLNHWCGREERRKPWLQRRTCDRKSDHPAHEWGRLCSCD